MYPEIKEVILFINEQDGVRLRSLTDEDKGVTLYMLESRSFGKWYTKGTETIYHNAN